MSKTSDNPDLYYRASIAIKMERKLILIERMGSLGLKTVGDLVNMFCLADESVVDALAPHAKKFTDARITRESMAMPNKGTLIKELKKMTPGELQALIDMRDAASKKTEDDNL